MTAHACGTTEPTARAAPGVVRRSPSSARPLVVELVGPAAAGKSSVLGALAGSEPTLRAGFRIPRQRHLRTALGLAPTFLALHLPYTRLLWKEMKRITYLGTLHRLLSEPLTAGEGAVVLDEGAVYMLARLDVHGAEEMRSGAYRPWWRGAIEAWAHTLDLVVWLDAPDPVLRQRLRARPQPHPARALSDEAVDAFMTSYRAAYQRVIAALTATNGPRVLSVRTDRQPVGAIAAGILGELRTMGGLGQ